MKLCERICKGGCDVGSRFAVQTLGLDYPGTHGRIFERPSDVPYGLRVVMWALATGSVTAGSAESSEPDIVHDHIQLRQYQIAAIACVVVTIGVCHMQHAGTTECGEAVGCSSCGGELRPGGGAAEMISDGCSDTNRKVLVKGVGENLLPAAEACGL